MREPDKREEVVKIIVSEDEVKEGSICFPMTACEKVSGYITSSEYRMTCKECIFDNKGVTISYTFDAKGLSTGQVIKGEFCAITDAGEFFFPYEINVESVRFESSQGEIRNLFHFTNLARSNWSEARELFVNDRFPAILKGIANGYEDVREALLYNAKNTEDENRALEDFLVHIRKKEPVKVSVKETVFLLSDKYADSFELEFEKSGWGYSLIRLHDAPSSIRFEKETFDTTEFTSDNYTIKVDVDRAKLGVAGSKAEFILSIDDRNLKVKIEVKKEFEKKTEITDLDERHMLIDIMRAYLDYRTGHLSLSETASIVEAKLSGLRGRETVLPTLYEAHLKLLLSDTATAQWLLKHVKKLLQKEDTDDDTYGYYLYLVAMSKGEDSEKAKSLLVSYSETKPGVFSYLWGYMHSSGALKENPGRIYRMFKNLWKRGITTPVLYLEAALMVLKEPSLFEMMDEFELQLLFFMERYQLISEDFVPQVFEAAASFRRYSPMLLSVLKRYPAENEKQMLKVFCTQYLRGDCTGKEAADHLRRGIESDVRITGLYEAYIRALDFDMDEELPREAVHYFSYGSSLDDAHKAYVYSLLLSQKENLSDKQMISIREFTMSELKKEHISSSLAKLYCDLLEPEDMSDELKSALLKLVFAREIVFTGTKVVPNAEWVYVRHNGMKKVGRYPLKGDRGVIFIYGSDFTVTVEDKKGRIHLPDPGDYKLNSYFEDEKLTVLLRGSELSGFEQAFFSCMKRPVEGSSNKNDFMARQKVARWLIAQDDLTDDKRYAISEALLKGFDRYDAQKEKEEFLESVPSSFFRGVEGEIFVKELLALGMYKKAYEAALYTGIDRFDGKVLIRLCQYALSENDEEYDERLVKLTSFVFEKHKYTTDMLKYLVKMYKGPVKQMRDVWKTAKEMEVDTLFIAERILTQMIRTGAYTSDRALIFKDYARSGGRNELVLSYLTDMAYAYLSREEAVEKEFFEEAEEFLKRSFEDAPVDLLLAVLKRRSEDDLPEDEKERELLKGWINEAVREGYYFPYYRVYEEICPELRIYGEETYIEFIDEPGMKIVLRYLFESENSEDGFKEEPLKEIYPGIYQRGFRLCYGQRILYYLIEKTATEEKTLTSGSIEPEDSISEGGTGRFHLINDIAIAKEMGDSLTVSSLEKKLEELDKLTADNLKIR